MCAPLLLCVCGVMLLPPVVQTFGNIEILFAPSRVVDSVAVSTTVAVLNLIRGVPVTTL